MSTKVIKGAVGLLFALILFTSAQAALTNRIYLPIILNLPTQTPSLTSTITPNPQQLQLPRIRPRGRCAHPPQREQKRQQSRVHHPPLPQPGRLRQLPHRHGCQTFISPTSSTAQISMRWMNG